MREILFRGKAANRKKSVCYRTNYKNGDWVYGLLTMHENYVGFAEMTNTDGINGIEVDPETIGQYTGLTDRNGNKVFEGDIVNIIYDCDEKASVIEFYNGGFCVNINNIFFNFQENNVYEFEKIGNVYDNPELLEGKSE